MFKNNKRGVAPLFIVLIIALILLAFYLFLFIPIPAFTKVRSIINYFIILILWVLVQVALIYGYYRLGKLVHRGYILFRTKFSSVSLKLEKYIITHS